MDSVSGLILTGTDLYAASSSNGELRRTAFVNGAPTGVLAKAQSAAGSTTLDLSTIRATVAEKLGIELPKSGIGSGEAAQAAVEAGDAQAGIEVLAPDEISTGLACKTMPRPLQQVQVVENASSNPVPRRFRVICTKPSDVTSDT